MVDLLTYQDQYEIQLGSVITDYDRKILTRLYQPIIGYKAISLYFTLWSELEADQTMSTTKKKHIRLFDMMNCTVNEFLKQRMYLEAIGLLKSFVCEQEEGNKYVYRLYAPLNPSEFFAHSLLCPLLKKAFTDENEFTRTKTYFLKSAGVKPSYQEISAKFTDVFKNLNKLEQTNLEDRYIGRVSLKVKTSFDFEAFYLGIKDYQIPKTLFTRDVIDEISLLSEAYGINAIDMRYVIMNSIEVINGNKQINFIKMREQATHYATQNSKDTPKKKEKEIVSISGNSNSKLLLDQYNSLSSVEFLKLRNHNMDILPSDIALIKELKNAGLIDSVINALLDYSLAKTGNIIVPNYIKKVAQTLLRNEIDNAYQAMIYLNNPKGYNRTSSPRKVVNEAKEVEKVSVPSKEKKSSTEDKWYDEEDKWW